MHGSADVSDAVLYFTTELMAYGCAHPNDPAAAESAAAHLAYFATQWALQNGEVHRRLVEWQSIADELAAALQEQGPAQHALKALKAMPRV